MVGSGLRGEQDQAHIWHSGQLTIKMLYCQETGSIGAGGGRQGGRGGLSEEASSRPPQRPGPSRPPPCTPLPASCPFSLLQPPLSSYYIFSYIFFPQLLLLLLFFFF